MWCYVDVHWSSGVANRAFYLAAKGLNQTCDQAVKPAAIGGCGVQGGAQPHSLKGPQQSSRPAGGHLGPGCTHTSL
jgi:hypothetical protein